MGVGLGVVLLAERESALDQDGLLPHIPPLEGQRLAWPETREGEDADQRGVARRGHGAHAFHHDRGQRADLLASGHGRLSDRPRRVRLQMSALESALQNPAEQRRSVANGDSAASGREAIALPPGDHLRCDLDEAERAQLRKDVLVV